MSQCHDTYDPNDNVDRSIARLELRRDQVALHAVATLILDGRAVIGSGEAPFVPGDDPQARRTAIGQALVDLGHALASETLPDESASAAAPA
jgi:hypothetical protein